MLRSYKYRLYPSVEQREKLSQHFGCCRMVYNLGLDFRNQAYKASKASVSYEDSANLLPLLKRAHVWLKAVNAQSLQQSLKDADRAYKNFFKSGFGYPRFKSKHNKQSFRVPQAVRVEGSKLSVPKFREGIRFVCHRKLEGKIKSCTISLNASGQYHVSILCEVGAIRSMTKTSKAIGIDLGLTTFATYSDGGSTDNPRHLNKLLEKLAKAQRHLSRKTKGSNRRAKQRLKVARIHQAVKDTRNDFLQKLSTDLVRDFDTICIEDLNVSGMVKNRKLSRHIADASWSEFRRMLEYKCDWYGKSLVVIGRFHPSSKTCNKCKTKNEITLSQRTFVCSGCGSELHRDKNAALNILEEGLKIHRVERTITGAEGTLDTRKSAEPIEPPKNNSV